MLQPIRDSRPRMTLEKHRATIQQALPALYKNHTVGVVKRSTYETQLLYSQSTLKHHKMQSFCYVHVFKTRPMVINQVFNVRVAVFVI